MHADDPITRELAELVALMSQTSAGRMADYIPELERADPEHCGLALVSVDGHVFAAGDADVPFTAQSVSKPFVYGLALADLGLDEVFRHVGAEPSGEPFNAISLEPTTGRPANPMINAGAIVTSALVRGADAGERFERIRSSMSAFAGRSLDVDERVYASELHTGDRNRALAYLTRAAGILPGPVDDAVDVYFRQCAVVVSAVDLAVMAATLAHGGLNPRTGTRVVDEPAARQVMSVMASCGMYDHAGEWLLRVGLPAKSGVSGGIAALSPAQFGIGVYSPPLDRWGNSSRGVVALTELSRRYDLHLLHHPGDAASPIAFTERGEHGEVRIALQGELEFAAAERVVHHLRAFERAADGPPRHVVLDISAVTRLHPVAERLISAAAADLRAIGIATSMDPSA